MQSGINKADMAAKEAAVKPPERKLQFSTTPVNTGKAQWKNFNLLALQNQDTTIQKRVPGRN